MIHVLVIIVENEMTEEVQFLEKALCDSLYDNSFVEGINQLFSLLLKVLNSRVYEVI